MVVKMKKAMLPDQPCAAFESAILKRASLIKLSEMMMEMRNDASDFECQFLYETKTGEDLMRKA